VQSRPCRTQPCATAPPARVLGCSNLRRLAGQPRASGSPPPLSTSSFRAGTSPCVRRPALTTSRPEARARGGRRCRHLIAPPTSPAASPTVRLLGHRTEPHARGPGAAPVTAPSGRRRWGWRVSGDSGRMPPIVRDVHWQRLRLGVVPAARHHDRVLAALRTLTGRLRASLSAVRGRASRPRGSWEGRLRICVASARPHRLPVPDRPAGTKPHGPPGPRLFSS
jgi:hypothetical protein